MLLSIEPLSDWRNVNSRTSFPDLTCRPESVPRCSAASSNSEAWARSATALVCTAIPNGFRSR